MRARLWAMVLLICGLGAAGGSPAGPAGPFPSNPETIQALRKQATRSNAEIIQAFGKQGIRINAAEAQGIRDNVLLALDEARSHGIGNSKVDFAAVEIASELGLDTSKGSSTVHNVVGALKYLLEHTQA